MQKRECNKLLRPNQWLTAQRNGEWLIFLTIRPYRIV